MNKLLKFIPAALLTVTVSTGCGSKNKLQSFVDGLKDGDLTKEEIEGIYAEGILESGDKDVKFAQYYYGDYSPFWTYAEGQEESFYEENVHNLQIKETFRSYDNNIVVTSTDYTNYPYDKSTIKDPTSDDGFARKPIKYTGKAHIYENAGEMRYTYTQDNKSDDAYSFTHAVETNNALREHFTKGGGFSTNVISGVLDVEDTYSYYAGSITWAHPLDTFTANKKDGKLTVRYTGDLNYDIYSAERVWGWTYAEDDVDYEHPLTKETDEYDGMYVLMGIRFEYGYTIGNGIVESVHMQYFSYYRILYKDRNHKAGDPLPDFEPSAEYMAQCDLYIPEKISMDGEEIPNPYTGVGYLSSLPYTVETYSSSKEALGAYEKSDIPDPTKYRECDSIDSGAWFNVHELDEEY